MEKGFNLRMPLAIVLWITLTGCFRQMEQKVIFSISSPPYSADTIEYDYFGHHQVFRSVLGSLVSVYSKGEISPFIASSWEFRDNKKKWKFIIRENVLFEDGITISPEIVAKSFCRMAYLQKNKNSKSGLLEFIVGFENINSINTCEGITFDESAVYFNFIKPIENLLELISFGQYSIVSPDNYDKNGKWIDDKKAVSSSFYRIESWGESELVLLLRKDFIEMLGHNKKYHKIKVVWGSSYRDDADIKTASSMEPHSEKYDYISGANSNIFFLRIVNWKHHQILSNTNVRKKIRSLFYKKIKDNGFEITNSFFPISIKGIREMPLNEINDPNPISGLSGIKYSYHSNKKAHLNIILEKIVNELDFDIVNPTVQEKSATLDPNASGFKVDLFPMHTGILIDNPYDDVKFMFLSKEGILLPDSTGELVETLKKDSFDLQRINELIYEQAIIWPLIHFSDGVLIKDDIDITMLNTIYPPIDFAFVGLK